MFRVLPVDADTLSRRWGVDFVKADEELRQEKYSFIWFDLEEAHIQTMNPLPLPKDRPKPKKKGLIEKIFTKSPLS